MERPKRLKFYQRAFDPELSAEVDGYNKAYYDWEKYHNWVMAQLPTEEELVTIIQNSHMSNLLACSLKHIHDPLHPYDTPQRKLAKAIHERLVKP